MNTTSYKQQLIDLLKSDEQVKEAIEKLEFGCKFKQLYTEGEEVVLSKILGGNFYAKTKEGEIHFPHTSQITEIIGLPLQERFIRMYCEKFNFIDGDVTLEKYRCLSYNNTIEFEKRNMDDYSFDLITEIKIDNTKDFDNQSEETYKQIFLALNNL